MDVTQTARLSTFALVNPCKEYGRVECVSSRTKLFHSGPEEGSVLKAGCRGRSWSRRLDDKCGFLKRSTALHVARAGPKQDGPSGDGLSSSKPSVEKNGSSFHPEEVSSVDLDKSGGTKGAVNPLVTTAGASNSSGSRAGLFRTPISGGVQSATSSHGLPHPAIAVRNLIEQARFAHLCTVMSRMHHRRRGYPFGSLVDFATDNRGHPIFSLSPLAIHTRNLLADPRCTLVVQIPGWSGLANARVTIFGDVYPLPPEQQELAHKYYRAKHQQGASQQWSNFTFYRMENISDIYFVGGFGTVQWVDVEEYDLARPDLIAVNGAEKTLQELNLRFSKKIRELLAVESEVDDAALISIDSKGVDVRVRQGAQFNVRRMSFDEVKAVETLDQAIVALQKIVDRGVRFLH
ncbi:uncharacterized protein [Physcomitrium patens]|uniref:CREG-like beta-barrel domain-containing protein n=1 Tax=Physcomitrium patens TaxID=3218 RepID=A0A2K1IXC8_PHYPA|nr:uncharacterized protein LOC112272674 isoform X2 [Physcomitrium patens]PNR33929.1 hypothetical protein PHYPA_023745 [Physcomitrium patens]|eukprot:XP_024356438.1 uncharacterized protein LOC112272674 isoform X2 [Physcomitrella patens]